MKFRRLSVYLEKLEKTSSRIEITKILADLFKESSSSEIDKIVYLLLGSLAPRFEGVVFNVADKLMLSVLSSAYRKEKEEVKRTYQKLGDIGDVAYALARTQDSRLKTQDLAVVEVYERLLEVAKDEGGGSQERKVDDLAGLLRQLDPLSAKFVTRIPVGKLRLGFSDKTILDGLSWMERGDKSAKGELDRAYHVLPDVGLLAKHVRKVGIKKATAIPQAEVGVPVLPMLAQRLKSPAEMIEKMGKVAIEPKLDGLRIQIHFDRGSGLLKAFTRNLNDVSGMFPELGNLEKFIKVSKVILDTEAIGVDEKRQKMADFQATMTRRRKHDVAKYATGVPLRFYCFDILLKDSQKLMHKDYQSRRKVLGSVVKTGGLLRIVESRLTSDSKEIKQFNVEQRRKGFEGIMVKKVDSGYVPGRTGWRWVKMKEGEEFAGKLADTVDCVVMGYTRGKGKRASFGVGQFLVGVRDRDRVKTISKVGTGLTDKQFKELAVRLRRIEVGGKPFEYEVQKDYEPDYWVKPQVVVELAADDLTRSPKHTSGYALRFPRLVKFRDDKSPDQVTTLKEVEKLFKLQ